DEFLSRHAQIIFLLKTLVEISQSTFFVLHQSLLDVAKEIDSLNRENWTYFKRVTLNPSIKTLERFVQMYSESTLENEAASYQSQRELSFVRYSENTTSIVVDSSSSSVFSPISTL